MTDYSQITVMILDSATPGRMSIRYYRELSGSRLMDAVEDWHRNFAWEQCYRKEQKEEKREICIRIDRVFRCSGTKRHC